MITSSDVPQISGVKWGFVALQYHSLILNRVYLVCIGPNAIVGLVGGGPVISPLIVTEKMQYPFNWVSQRKLQTYSGLTLETAEVQKRAFANFIIPFEKVLSVSFTHDAKWGMGAVPYSGRVFVQTPHKKHEFILLGKESAEEVCKRLAAAVSGAQLGVQADRP